MVTNRCAARSFSGWAALESYCPALDQNNEACGPAEHGLTGLSVVDALIRPEGVLIDSMWELVRLWLLASFGLLSLVGCLVGLQFAGSAVDMTSGPKRRLDGPVPDARGSGIGELAGFSSQALLTPPCAAWSPPQDL
jgi:hypothetical protein